MRLNGKSLGNGYFVEFFVVERTTSSVPIVHRLNQGESVTFSDMNETKDYIPAAEIENPTEFSVAEKPLWEGSEAIWPTAGGTPMVFVGQVALPKNEVTQKLLTWNTNVYLFCRSLGGTSRFKIVTQKAEFQSAEAHYSQEE